MAYLQAKYPLVKACDMPADLKDEVLDICLSVAEKFPKDYEKCTQESFFFQLPGEEPYTTKCCSGKLSSIDI